MGRLLIVEDEVVLARSILTFLNRQGFEGKYATNIIDAKSAFIQDNPELVILDYKLQTDDGLELLVWMRERNPNCHIVMMTAHGDVELAVNAMKSGARDFMVKPVPLKMIADMTSDLLETSSHEKEAFGIDRLVGRSAATVNLRKSVQKLAAFCAAAAPPGILIMGDTGSGKSTIAQALHETSPRARCTYNEIDCTSTSHDRIDSMRALFRETIRGTLVLRNVEALSLELQDILMGLLQEQPERSQCPWLLSTTIGRQLESTASQRFRSDLLYQLQVGWIEVPPLVERASDILPIAEHVARYSARKYKLPPPQLSSEARIVLLEYHWPGNIAELVNCIERAVFHSSNSQINAADLRMLGSAGDSVPKLDQMEEQALNQALKAAGGNVSKAARLLGISRDKMRYRMQRMGLSRR